jgi:flagellin
MSILRINNNISALNTQRNLNVNSFNLSKTLQRLSSGYRINVAADGPADLIISEGLRGQLSGMKAAIRNNQEAANFVGIAEGALQEVSDLLTQMRALSVHAANRGVVSQAQANADNQEFVNARLAINRIEMVTRFAGDRVFTGVLRTFQVNERNTANDQVPLTVPHVSAASLGLGIATISALANAQTAMSQLSTAITTINTLRGNLGAFQKNTLQTNINSLTVAVENVTATESYIRDANMAEETSNFTKNQILVQAGVAVLAQANVLSQSVLKLLG